MNMYDKAHELARALKLSDEARAVARWRDELNRDPEAKQMLDNFQQRQWEFERKRMMGEEVGPDEEEQLRKLHDVVQLHATVREYLNAEYRLGTVLSDVQRILGDTISEIIGQDKSEPPLN